MKVFYYCSYTGSPVGYIPGGFTYSPGQTEDYRLSSENIPQLIRKCFELGTVRKAFGVLPTHSEMPEYFLLIKKLVAKEDEKGSSFEYYLNFALTTKNEKEYRGWLQKDKETDEHIAESIKRTMNLDRTSDFGFTICSQELDKLLKVSFGSLLEDVSIEGQEIYLELASSQTDLNSLKEMLQLLDQEKELKWNSKRWAYYGKKKVVMRNRWLIIAAVILLIAILIGIKIIGIQESNI